MLCILILPVQLAQCTFKRHKYSTPTAQVIEVLTEKSVFGFRSDKERAEYTVANNRQFCINISLLVYCVYLFIMMVNAIIDSLCADRILYDLYASFF